MKEEELKEQLDYYNLTFGDEQVQFKTAEKTELTPERASSLADRSAKKEKSGKDKSKKGSVVLDA